MSRPSVLQHGPSHCCESRPWPLAAALTLSAPCILQFMVSVVRRVLAPAQVATLDVSAFPGGADIVALAEALAASAGEPSAADIMAQGVLSLLSF